MRDGDINGLSSMTLAEFKGTCWSYYLTLEEDVLNVEPYVSFHPDNYRCFSNEFIKLYQAICSEIDALCKEYCKYITKTPFEKGKCKIDTNCCAKKKEKNEKCRIDINCYAKCILGKHPEIEKQTVDVLRYVNRELTLELTPWKGWSPGTPPEWWKKYNKVKHDRFNSDTTDTNKRNYQHANLENVLNAQAALYVLEEKLFTVLVIDETRRTRPLRVPRGTLSPESSLFRPLWKSR